MPRHAPRPLALALLAALALSAQVLTAGCGARTDLTTPQKEPPPTEPEPTEPEPTEPEPTEPEPTEPVDRPAVSIAAGLFHTCSARMSGRVDCWGFNDLGQLGDGTIEIRDRPVRVIGVDDAVQVTAGRSHSCARTTSGAVYCWGANGEGQLGLGAPSLRSLEPEPVAGIDEAVQIAAGARHTCALARDGTVRCWGERFGPAPEPVAELAGASRIGTGFAAATCIARDDGEIVCLAHERDDMGFVHRLAEEEGVPEPVVDLSIGDYHGCAVTESARVTCWGDNRYGQLGNGTSGDRDLAPLLVAGLEDVQQVAAGHEHSCALSRGSVRCWGRNDRGQLGDGSDRGLHAEPRRLEGLEHVVEITTGWRHSCARTERGKLYCWGRDVEGQLGNASRDYVGTPTRVEEPR